MTQTIWATLSVFQRDESSKSRIREAVLSGFDVTRKPVFEGRVSGDFDDEVVPTMELIQRQLVFKRLARLEKPRAQLACMGTLTSAWLAATLVIFHSIEPRSSSLP